MPQRHQRERGKADRVLRITLFEISAHPTDVDGPETTESVMAIPGNYSRRNSCFLF